MKIYVDRTNEIAGVNRTIRDSRVPFNFPRALDNVSLPDKRIRKRPGYGSKSNPVVLQALSKATGVRRIRRVPESIVKNNTQYITPLSYAVIRWQSEYQLRVGEDKTIEFSVRLGDKEELVINPIDRYADKPAAIAANYIMRTSGVYLIDQTITSNVHKFYDGSVALNGTVTAGTAHDLSLAATGVTVFPLTTFAVKFIETELRVSVMLFEDATSRYIKCDDLTYSFSGSGYTVGSIYHVAIINNATAGELRLYIDGVLQDTLVIPAGYSYVGEKDNINGIAYANGQKRDIVLLNESVCRGSYSSAARLSNDVTLANNRCAPQAYHQAYSITASTGNSNPWCQSPPKGTAMWDLRIWDEDRAANLVAFKDTRILPTDSGISNLTGNWYLSDGGSVCANSVTGLERRFASVHYGYPSFVDEPDLINSRGIKLDDNQYVILSTRDGDDFLGDSLQEKLVDMLGYDSTTSLDAAHQDKHSFTIQMQIMIPEALQPELNDSATALNVMKDVDLVEIRREIKTGNVYTLKDGGENDGVGIRRPFAHPTDATVPYATNQTARSFDQTLFSIEGTQIFKDNMVSDEAYRTRIPLIRGLITPSGKVALELYKREGDIGASIARFAAPQYVRLLENTTVLVPGRVYSIVFTQFCSYTPDANNNPSSRNWTASIFINDLTTSTTSFNSKTFNLDTVNKNHVFTSFCKHLSSYDIIIGSSYVNDGMDLSIRGTKSTFAVSGQHTNYNTNAAARRSTHAPWPIQQHFMTPFQDQPANIIVGCFRMWSVAQNLDYVNRFAQSNIPGTSYGSELLVNLEFDSVTGSKIRSKCSYQRDFSLGFKGWGVPIPILTDTTDIDYVFDSTLSAVGISIPEEEIEATYSCQDCLGYIPIYRTYDTRGTRTPINGITEYRSLLAETFGSIVVTKDSAAIDQELNGQYSPLSVANTGLLSEFEQNKIWHSVVIGDRTFLSSVGSLVKVFDGANLQVAGPREWDGGQIMTYPLAGSIATAMHYGILVVYVSETHNISIASSVSTIRLAAAGSIYIPTLPLHPDLRVSRIEIYRTTAQVSRDLALNAPLYKVRTINGGSAAFTAAITLDEIDTALAGRAQFDRNFTSVPEGAYLATANGRLYIGGNKLNPDTVYFSDSGNQEVFDSVFNSVDLQDGTGNVQTGMVAAFNSIFVFKPNGIWRVVDNGQFHQAVKVSEIGAISEQSTVTFQDPDSGRTLIFFWSHHGPYLFDGNVAQYIGTTIEERGKSDVDIAAGIVTNEFFWLDPASIVVVHNVRAREIMCSYRPVYYNGSAYVTRSVRNEAVVFNYRAGGWSKYTNIVCDVGLAFTYTRDSLVSNPPVSGGKSVESSRNFEYLMLLGGYNGVVYQWDSSLYDGVPLSTVGGRHTITGVAATVLSLEVGSGINATTDWFGVWVTLVDPTTNKWFSARIIANGTDEITISGEDSTIWPFIITTSTQVHIGINMARVLFPWDELDKPLIDKQIHELITWHDGNWQYRIAINYREAGFSLWKPLDDTDGVRKKTIIDKRSDAFKLELATLGYNAGLNALGYIVHYAQDGTGEQ